MREGNDDDIDDDTSSIFMVSVSAKTFICDDDDVDDFDNLGDVVVADDDEDDDVDNLGDVGDDDDDNAFIEADGDDD